ncbi:hypothetical protein FB451DRAFT_1551167 [Mycena latifolia]|nr:hypothetical protein FB451DRAFT_1551167 [Mycena latifolia]
MPDATEMVFRLQELCDQIACHITHEASREDLKSAALVCHTLCISAQSHIFHHVGLDPWELPDGDICTHDSETALSAASSASRRLSAILTASPHLLRHIRHLSVLGRSEILKLVSNLRLPLLRKIEINFQDTPWPDDDALHLARDLIGLPSVREVEIRELYMRLGMPGDLDLKLFPSIFDTCTRDLHSLAFISIIPTSTLPTTCKPRPSERRARIKRLQLRWTVNLGNWFISPSCPFDFTHLLEVETDAGKKNFDLLQVLTSARLSITRLQMTGDLALLVNLSDFPALTCLEIHHSNIEAISSLTPDNRVEIFGLHINVRSFERGLKSKAFSSTDAFIANFPLPVLQQVDVQIHGPANDWFGFELESVQRYFPQLASRGLLVVTDHRFRGPVM